jgi:hypothetical protein
MSQKHSIATRAWIKELACNAREVAKELSFMPMNEMSIGNYCFFAWVCLHLIDSGKHMS